MCILGWNKSAKAGAKAKRIPLPVSFCYPCLKKRSHPWEKPLRNASSGNFWNGIKQTAEQTGCGEARPGGLWCQPKVRWQQRRSFFAVNSIKGQFSHHRGTDPAWSYGFSLLEFSVNFPDRSFQRSLSPPQRALQSTWEECIRGSISTGGFHPVSMGELGAMAPASRTLDTGWTMEMVTCFLAMRRWPCRT